jgi:hypothetical protein
MSKLGDSIRRTLRTSSVPIGFGRAPQGATDRSLVVSVVFSSLSADRAREAVSKGADTCLFAVPDPKEAELEKVLEALGETPGGLLTQRADRSSLDRLADLGLDYVALEPEIAPAAALLHPRLGRVLIVADDLSDSHLRTLEAMSLEAVFLRSWTGSLTVRAQMELQRIAGFSRKPLMLPVQPVIESPDLEALREAGVAVLAIDGDRREDLEALSALKQAVQSLPPRRRGRDERPEAILPSAQALAGAEQDEEEDDDDDDDDEEDWEP